MPSDVTRRGFVDRAVTALAVGAVGSTAGCLDDGLLGGGTDLGDEMHQWGPSPNALPGEFPLASGHYSLQGQNLTAVRSAPDRVQNLLVSPVIERLEPLELAPDDVSATVGIGSRSTAVRANYDGETVAGRLADGGFDRIGSYGDFRLFSGGLLPGNDEKPIEALIGIDGSYVLVATLSGWRPEAGESVLRTVVDAYNGDADRYAETEDAVRALIDHLDPGLGATVVGMNVISENEAHPEYGRFEGLNGIGTDSDIDGETLTVRRARAFENESRIPGNDALNPFYESGGLDNGGFGFERRETRRDGRILTIVYEADATDLPTQTPTE